MYSKHFSSTRTAANWALALGLALAVLFSAVSPAYAAVGDPITSVTVGAQGTALTYGSAGGTSFVVTVTSSAKVSNLGLTVAGLPAGATGTFSPNKLSFLAAGSKQTTLTINTTAAAQAGAWPFSVGTRLGNKAGAAVGSGTLTIDRLLLTIDGQLVSDKAYDGTANATFNPACSDVITTSCYSLHGVLGTDDVNLVTGTADFVDVNAGAQDVNVSGLALGGSNASNYDIQSSTTATATILQAPLTVTGQNVFYWIFSPDPAPTVFEPAYVGFVNGEDASVLPEAPACDIPVAHDAPGTYAIVCSGGSGGNYAFTFLVYDPAHPELGGGFLTVSADNEPPSDINLSNPTVAERLAAGAVVGNLTTADPEQAFGETYQYSLVDTLDCAGPDNASFTIPDTITNGGVPLQTAGPFYYATKSSYTVCVETNDGGNTFDKQFVITVLPSTLKVKSYFGNDGWVLESGEFTKVGGTKNNTSTRLLVGDDKYDRQYRSILSFGTGALPENAIIYSVTIRVKQASLTNANIFQQLGALRLGIKKPAFGKAALELTDFQAVPSMVKAATFGTAPDAEGWYSAVIGESSTAIQYINLAGTTQFRIYFAKDDNNNMKANVLSLYSGNALAVNRPEIIISYSMPAP